MITTVWKCDHCDHEQQTAEQMWIIAVTYRHADGRPYVSTPSTVVEELWCRKCVDGSMLIGRLTSAKDPVAPPQPTLEDLIRELLRETVREVVREEVPS